MKMGPKTWISQYEITTAVFTGSNLQLNAPHHHSHCFIDFKDLLDSVKNYKSHG